MRNFLRYFYLLTLSLVICCSCSKGDDPEPPKPDPDPTVKGHRTVLAYFVADNNLERFATSDLLEIEAGLKKSGIDLTKDQLVVYLDDKGLPRLFKYCLDKNRNLVADSIPIFDNPEDNKKELTSTDPEVISHVIKRVVAKFPAEHYGMIYWSHGDGWKPSTLKYAQRSLNPLSHVGADQNNGKELSSKRTDIPDLSKALGSFPKKLDFLFFDACFMLSMETAWDLRDHTECIIGSPTETPGPGAPYDHVMVSMLSSSDFSANSFSEIYFNYYNAMYNGGSGSTDDHWTAGVSIGVIKTDALEDLARFCALLARDGDRLQDTGKPQALDYDKRRGTYVGYFDMVGLYEHMIKSAADYTEWLSLYNKAVPYFKTTPKNYSSTVDMFDMTGAHGASVYYPSTSYSAMSLNSAYRKTSWYEAAGLSCLGW